jgi:glycosyltransferase involved in cell wall biosynthesis
MRIEMVLPALPRAGMEVMSANLARALRDRGHEVGFTSLLPGGDLADELADSGFRVSVVSAPGIRSHLYPVKLRRWLVTLRLDVLHVHSGAWMKGAQAARLAGVPRIVCTVHGMEARDPWHHRRLDRLASRRTDVVVAVSRALRCSLMERTGLGRDRVMFIPNGVPVPAALPLRDPELRQQLGIPAGGHVVGSVARLTPVKNHALMLDAFARVHSQLGNTFLLLVGDGPCRPAVEDQARRLGVADRVRITGEVRDASPFYAQMDVFCLSSLHEGTSLSLLEAMAHGIPGVATAVGGNVEVLDHGRAGVLAATGDAAALATGVVHVLTSREARTALVEAAADHLTAHYSLDAMVRRYEDVYAGRAAAVPRTNPPERDPCAE